MPQNLLQTHVHFVAQHTMVHSLNYRAMQTTLVSDMVQILLPTIGEFYTGIGRINGPTDVCMDGTEAEMGFCG